MQNTNLITVYIESSPNPNSIKFMLSTMLMADGISKDFSDAQTATDSPLAQALFNEYSFATRIFMSQNFITVSKNDTVSWEEVSAGIRQFIMDYFEAEKPIFAEELPESKVELTNDNPKIKRIKEILNEYIRPAVEMDGGAIDFENFEEESGKLTVVLKGSCHGCPSSMITLKSGIENLFSHMMPEVKEVVAGV